MYRFLQKFKMVGILFCLSCISTAYSIDVGNGVQISGYSGFEVECSITEEKKSKADPNCSFDADLFDLVLNIQVTNNFRVASDITWEHGAATEDGRGNVAVEYAFPEYTFSPLFKVRAGKMFVPFGIYNEIHTAKPAFLTVKEPLSTNKIHKFGHEGGSTTNFFPRWATGLSFVGGTLVGEAFIDYNVQVSNGDFNWENADGGQEEHPHDKDDNIAKALAGRVRATIDDLRIGGSFYTDWRAEYVFDEDEGADMPTDTKLLLFSVGFQLEYEIADIGMQFEYVGGGYEVDTETTIYRHGLTAMLTYNLGDRFIPYVRYEFLDPNDTKEKDFGHMLVYGVNTEIAESLFLKTELNTVFAEEENDRFGSKKNSFTEFKAQIAVGF
jgi:hypothetical protein